MSLRCLNLSDTIHLGVQQCFGVVYHELTTLRRVYLLRAAKTEQNKPVLALLIHEIPRRIHCWILFNNDKQMHYILLSDFQIRQNEAWVITNNQRFAMYYTIGITELLNLVYPAQYILWSIMRLNRANPSVWIPIAPEPILYTYFRNTNLYFVSIWYWYCVTGS